MRLCAAIAIGRDVFRGDVNTLVELFMWIRGGCRIHVLDDLVS